MKNEVIVLDTIVVRPDYNNETKKMQIVIIS